jgi:PAS domain S-box-containing protein
MTTIARLLGFQAAVITQLDHQDIEILATNTAPDLPFRAGDRHHFAGHYCEAVIRQQKDLCIEDARRHPRWQNCPEASAGLISYFGYPLHWPDGTLYGSLCLFGSSPHQLSPLHRSLVKHISELIEGQLASLMDVWKTQRNALVMLETMFESSPDAIAILDMEARILQCNRVFWELYGADGRDALIGLSAFDLIAEHEQARARNHLKALPEQGTIRHRHYTFLTQDRREIPVEVSSSVARDPEGTPRTVILIVQDITERQQAQQALADQQAQLGSILRAAPIGIGLLVNRVFKHINDQFCSMTGYRRDELIEQNARILYLSETEYERVGRDKYGQIRRRGTGTVETRWRCKDGKVLDILLSSTPLSREDWSLGVTFTALDITDRKTYQSKLRSLAQQLSIAEEQERRRVAVGVHDDIGQKLVLAKLELQSLQTQVTTGPTTEALSRICTLIDETMQEARTLAFDLSNPVLYEVGFDAAVESWLARQIKEVSGIDYTFTTRHGRVKLGTDTEIMLFRIVRELLTNVVKHAQASRIDVTIENDSSRVRIIVTDNGVGFDTGHLDWDTERSAGLGLFSVRERMEYLDGTLDLQSAPGQGTTVILSLPNRPPGRPQEATSASSDRSSHPPSEER